MMVIMNCLNVILIIYLLLIIATLSKESSFIVVTDQGTKDWSNANTYCNDTYGTTLVTISSIDVANAVIAAITNSSTPNAQMWLGLNDRETENVFVWTDGTSCNTTSCNDYWGGNEPNNVNGNEHCVAILPFNSVYDIFNDYPCDNLRYFICNAPKYIAITDQGYKNWSDANNYCSTVYGTTLATFVNDNDAKQVFIAALNSNSLDTFFYVGLTDLNNPGFWEFTDGTLCNDSNCINLSYWSTNEPSGGDQHCARFYISNPPNSDIYPTLDDVHCSLANRNFFVCNVRFTEITTTSQPTTSQPTTSKPTTREPTTSSPTGNPTTIQPTTRKPTANNPTTVYPTISPPTRYPSKKASISQSTTPTEERSGSVQTSTSTTSTTSTGDDEDFTIKVTTNNGTFNQYHVIRTVNYSLNVFLDTGYTLTADIIHPNISINFLIDIYDEEEINLDINSSELTQKIQGDLNKDSDIIYVVEVTANVEEEREMKHPFGFDKFNQLMMGICVVLALVIIISYIDAKWCRINDYFRVTALIIAVFQFVDMIYDCLFSVKITLDPNYSTQPSLFTILLLSITFIVIPTFITLIQLHFEMKQWKRNDVLSQWMFDNTALLYILSTICGSSFIAVRVCCSNLLNLSYFDMPLTQIQKASFYTKRIYSSVMFENVPQIMIQIVYLLISKNKTQHNDIVYASMSFSILSIVISILTILSQQNIIKTRDFVTIEFDVKGDMILSKFNRCRNRYKILRKQLSLIFGIHSNIIEIRKPSLIPNGLRVHIIVHINNTKAIDINCEKLIKDAHQNGRLGKILKESWSLSATPIIENIKYEKHDSEDRKNKTVYIKSMSVSEQMNNNDTNTHTINTSVAMVTVPPIPGMSAADTEQPGNQQQGDQYMHPMMPPIIPTVIITDYGESEGNKEGNNSMDDTHSSENNNKEIVVDEADQDVVQYVNNINNVTVGASKQ